MQPLPNRLMIRPSLGIDRPASSDQLKQLLGLSPDAKLPSRGMLPQLIQGFTVYVRPLALPSGQNRRRQHRVRVICPQCGRDISAGRLAQHRCR